MKHKWYDVIVAYANGKPIQFKYKNSNTWYDTNNLILDSTMDDLEFRIKPELVCYLDSAYISNSITYNHTSYPIIDCSITFNVKMNEIGTKEGFKLFYKDKEVFPNT